MSAEVAGPPGPLTIKLGPRLERVETRAAVRHSVRTAALIRIVSFAALGAYGVTRWATLISAAPTGRLWGLLALALGIVVAVPPLRRLGAAPAIAAAALLSLLALPIAGLNWHDFLHLRIAVSARAIGDGLSGLPGAFVPYAGTSQDIRTVIVLGAAALLLDGAIVLAFAPTRLADARHAGAALPLIALAVVPSTLLRPELPYFQGFILFVLLVQFVWGERTHWQGRGTPLLLLGVAGLLGAVIAPRLDAHRPWLDYRAWTGNLAHAHLDQFAWNQTYGPLHWPRSGHVVLTVTARRADYWKAEDLDVFNGYDWVSAPVSGTAPPAPSAAALAKWSEPIQVSITGMTSSAVIASGYSGAPTLPGGAAPGQDGAGTWVSYEPLRPGSHYTVETYSPHPSPGQLTHTGGAYPDGALAAYRSLTIPEARAPRAAYPQLTFAPFRAGHEPAISQGGDIGGVLRASAYAPVFALARHLAAGTRTQYAYAMAVSRYLDSHFSYNENPPARPYPLVSFLFGDKIGYCQQFSGAMALLLRMGGVPARVAAGFTSGSRNTHGSFAVTDLDAHAWVEVWFPHYGWVRFDPTPAVAPARGGNLSARFLKNLTGVSTIPSGTGRRDPQSAPAPATHRGRHRAGPTSPWLLLPAAVVVLLGGLLVASLVSPEPDPEEQLRELERALARSGRPLGPDVTLAELERRFRDSAGAAAYLRDLRLGRYAARAPAPVPGGRRALRDQLRRGLGATGRLRALWALPPRPRLRSRRPAKNPEAPGGRSGGRPSGD